VAAVGANHTLAVVAIRDAAFKTGHIAMVGPGTQRIKCCP
jgi:hypothetical protein